MVEGSGVCAPVGGCLGGVWTVVATPDKAWADTYIENSPGQTTDTFEVKEVSSTACLRWNINTVLRLYKISASGTQIEVRNMGCNNKEYELQATFSCTGGCYAPAGFTADPTAALGCSLASGLQRRLVTDFKTIDSVTDGTAILATLKADDETALIFGIVCGSVALILVAGCVYVIRRKKRHDTLNQELRPWRCDPDDLEGANCQTQTEPELERAEYQGTSEQKIGQYPVAVEQSPEWKRDKWIES